MVGAVDGVELGDSLGVDVGTEELVGVGTAEVGGTNDVDDGEGEAVHPTATRSSAAATTKRIAQGLPGSLRIREPMFRTVRTGSGSDLLRGVDSEGPASANRDRMWSMSKCSLMS